MDSGSDIRGIVFFWALIVLGPIVSLVLSGVDFVPAIVGTAVAIGATAAVFAALALVVAVGGLIVFSVMALLGSKDGT